MAEAVAKTTVTKPKVVRAIKREFSMPVIEGEVTLNSEQAQRVFHRGYDQAARALYALDVVLRITQRTNPNFKVSYDSAIDHAASLIDTVAGELEKERQRLSHLIEKNGVTSKARYNNSKTIPYAVNTPLAARFAGAVYTLDEVIQMIDTLWLTGVITSHAAAEAKYGGQRRLLRVVRTLVGYAIAARRSARRAGHAEAISQALGQNDNLTLSDDLESADDTAVEAAADVVAVQKTTKPKKQAPAAAA